MCPAGGQVLGAKVLDQPGPPRFCDLIFGDKPSNPGISPVGYGQRYHKHGNRRKIWHAPRIVANRAACHQPGFLPLALVDRRFPY